MFVQNVGTPFTGFAGYGVLVYIIDYNNDGYLDIVGKGIYAEAHLLLNQAPGGIVLSRPGDLYKTSVGWSFDFSDMAFGDLDGDGDLDLAVFAPYAVNVQLFENDGGGQFTLLTGAATQSLSIEQDVIATVGCGGAWSGGSSGDRVVRWADYDQDGDLDLLVAGACKRVFLFRNDDGVLNNVWDDAETPEGLSQRGAMSSWLVEDAAWGDVNGDGYPDLVVGGYFATRSATLGRYPLQVFANHVNSNPSTVLARTQDWVTSFAASYDGPQDFGAMALALGDLDGDLDVDILVVGNIGGHVLTNDGSGQFTVVQNELTPSNLCCSGDISWFYYQTLREIAVS